MNLQDAEPFALMLSPGPPGSPERWRRGGAFLPALTTEHLVKGHHLSLIRAEGEC